MRVANPIYDAVFKYLLEDNQVAKVLLSNILDVKVHELEMEPTEFHLPMLDRNFTVFRIDFKATITLSTGERQVVLIEIQKAKLDSDILRFRKYLGAQYLGKPISGMDQLETPLPIYTIYFLGHTLQYLKDSPIININRDYIDNYSKEKLLQKEAFIECLTHNSVVVQIPLFKKYRRNKLEKLLSIFEASNNHEVEIEDLEDEEYQMISKRLWKANSNERVRQEMDIEDEIILELAQWERKVEKLELDKEEALKKEEEQRRQKEEAMAREKSIQQKLKKMIQLLAKEGDSVAEIARKFDLTEEEIKSFLHSS